MKRSSDRRRRPRVRIATPTAAPTIALLASIAASTARHTRAFVVVTAPSPPPFRSRPSETLSPRSRTGSLAMVREKDVFRPRSAPPDDDDDDGRISRRPDVVPDDYDTTDDYGDDEADWIPDNEVFKAEREWRRAEASLPIGQRPGSSATGGASVDVFEGGAAAAAFADSERLDDSDDFFRPEATAAKPKSAYTQEEEELIEAMGGKSLESPSPRRESGFLGDCTLREISRDFQVPVCYLADALCGWGVPVPIDVDARLGDMVTGEMAFAMVEAVHTLDVGELNDRYSNLDLTGLCHEWEIDLKEGFEYCIREGWNLPFGVRTFLRVEQEDELVRALSDEIIY